MKSRKKKQKTINDDYMEALNRSNISKEEKEQIKQILQDYPEPKNSNDGRRCHMDVSLDAMDYNKQIDLLHTPIQQVDDDYLVSVGKGIANVFLSLRKPELIIIALLSCAGYSLNQMEAITGVNRNTINTKIQEIKRNEVFKRIYDANEKPRQLTPYEILMGRKD